MVPETRSDWRCIRAFGRVASLSGLASDISRLRPQMARDGVAGGWATRHREQAHTSPCPERHGYGTTPTRLPPLPRSRSAVSAATARNFGDPAALATGSSLFSKSTQLLGCPLARQPAHEPPLHQGQFGSYDYLFWEMEGVGNVGRFNTGCFRQHKHPEVLAGYPVPRGTFRLSPGRVAPLGQKATQRITVLCQSCIKTMLVRA